MGQYPYVVEIELLLIKAEKVLSVVEIVFPGEVERLVLLAEVEGVATSSVQDSVLTLGPQQSPPSYSQASLLFSSSQTVSLNQFGEAHPTGATASVVTT